MSQDSDKDQEMNEESDSVSVPEQELIDIHEFRVENGLIHFLPFKFDYSGYANVKTYFDPLISESKDLAISSSGQFNYETSFRGKGLQGREVKIDGNIFFFKGIKAEKKLLKVTSVHQQESLFLWKFDENLGLNNNIANLQQIMKELQVLK